MRGERCFNFRSSLNELGKLPTGNCHSARKSIGNIFRSIRRNGRSWIEILRGAKKPGGENRGWGINKQIFVQLQKFKRISFLIRELIFWKCQGTIRRFMEIPKILRPWNVLKIQKSLNFDSFLQNWIIEWAPGQRNAKTRYRLIEKYWI